MSLHLPLNQLWFNQISAAAATFFSVQSVEPSDNLRLIMTISNIILVFILNRKHEEIEGNCVLLEIFFVLSCSLKIYKRILFEKISKSNTHWWKTCLFHTATSLFIFVVAKKRRRKEDLKMKWVSSKLPLNQWFKCESHLLLGQMRIQWI